MKWAYIVLLALFAAAGAPETLAPEFSLGSAGKAPLQFRNPGALLVAGNSIYVADDGNGRIQKISAEGKFLSQTGQWVGKWNGVASLAYDLAGMIYATGLHDSGVAQFDADLLPVSFHSVPSGFLCYEKSGDFLIAQPDRARILRWRMEGRQIQDITVDWLNNKPLLHCALWNKLFWAVDKRSIRGGDLFGPMKTMVRMEKPVRNAFFCPTADRMFVILDQDICEFHKGKIVVLARMPDNVLPGGAAATGNRIWISDRAENRIVRFALPSREEER